ncbi:PKD domain-containing protein [Xanthovirga aplysinae]|uniref:PKD domain-containing protein n=1 Tax=Xanthovirga aplysinae TaxID=2529853 RepID=UPI00165731B0|nr:PKD domain-containing protein [Xanthovirga aplysinae]
MSFNLVLQWITGSIIAQGVEYPTVDFSMPIEVCIGEQFEAKDKSINVDRIYWDLCPESYLNEGTAELLGNFPEVGSSYSMSTVRDKYGLNTFLVGSGNDKLTRLSYTEGLNSSFSQSTLGDFDGVLTKPSGIKFTEEAGRWIGVVSQTNGTVAILEFGDDVSSIPIASQVEGIAGLGYLVGMDIVVEDSNYYVFVVNREGDVYRLSFGNSLTNSFPTVDQIEVKNGALLMNIQLVKTSTGWYGVVGSNSNDKGIYLLHFGQELTNNNPSINHISGSGGIWGGPLSVVHEMDEYFVFQSTGNSLTRVDFGTNLSNPTPVIHDLGAYGLLNNPLSFEMINDRGEYFGIAYGRNNNQLILISYPRSCELIQANPLVLSYESSGVYDIILRGYSGSGLEATKKKRVTVIEESYAPENDFILDNTCISSENTFSPISNQVISSYIWDFGDPDSGESNTSTSPNPTHQFIVPGVYTVRLTVESENGCSNFIEKEITIYEEPIPSFEVNQDPKCSNGPIQFTNTSTGETGELVEWLWDFGDSHTSTEKEPSYTYEEGGDYEVTLTAKIPGCTSTFERTITITEGPKPAFSYTGDCFEEKLIFTNQTTDENIDVYLWQIWDENQQLLEDSQGINFEPELLEPGIYRVSLTATNDLDCSNKYIEEVTIHSLPEAAFEADLACSGLEVRFYDQSTVLSANISAWNWDFGDGQTSDEQNPVHVYEEPGEYLVSLWVESEYGCISETTIEKTITVFPSPALDYNFFQACATGYLSRFEAEASVADDSGIIEWEWVIKNSITNQSFYSTEQQAEFNLQEGEYEVYLSARAGNGCMVQVERTEMVYPIESLSPDFSWSNACQNEEITFTLNEESNRPEIKVYYWDFGDGEFSGEEQPIHVFKDEGEYEVNLQITYEGEACIKDVSNSVYVGKKPEAEIYVSNSRGAYPFEVEFENVSNYAESYSWYWGDELISESKELIYTFESIGTYEIKLVAKNREGCTSEVYQTIEVVEPELDVVLQGISAEWDADGALNFNLSIKNQGSVLLDDSLNIVIELGQEFRIKESFQGYLGAGELTDYSLNVGVPAFTAQKLSFVCASLEPQYNRYEELDSTNNKACVQLEGEEGNNFTVLDPYPNPVREELNVSVVLSKPGDLQISFWSVYGGLVWGYNYPDAPEGGNEFSYDLRSFRKGLYILKVKYDGVEEVKRVMIN